MKRINKQCGSRAVLLLLHSCNSRPPKGQSFCCYILTIHPVPKDSPSAVTILQFTPSQRTVFLLLNSCNSPPLKGESFCCYILAIHPIPITTNVEPKLHSCNFSCSKTYRVILALIYNRCYILVIHPVPKGSPSAVTFFQFIPSKRTVFLLLHLCNSPRRKRQSFYCYILAFHPVPKDSLSAVTFLQFTPSQTRVFLLLHSCNSPGPKGQSSALTFMQFNPS